LYRPQCGTVMFLRSDEIRTCAAYIIRNTECYNVTVVCGNKFPLELQFSHSQLRCFIPILGTDFILVQFIHYPWTFAGTISPTGQFAPGQYPDISAAKCFFLLFNIICLLLLMVNKVDHFQLRTFRPQTFPAIFLPNIPLSRQFATRHSPPSLCPSRASQLLVFWSDRKNIYCWV